MTRRRKVIMLYFSPKTDLLNEIVSYAHDNGLTISRAVWTLVQRGLEAQRS